MERRHYVMLLQLLKNHVRNFLIIIILQLFFIPFVVSVIKRLIVAGADPITGTLPPLFAAIKRCRSEKETAVW
jgi:hypothetical protein